jgi:hypothetical protein
MPRGVFLLVLVMVAVGDDLDLLFPVLEVEETWGVAIRTILLRFASDLGNGSPIMLESLAEPELPVSELPSLSNCLVFRLPARVLMTYAEVEAEFVGEIGSGETGWGCGGGEESEGDAGDVDKDGCDEDVAPVATASATSSASLRRFCALIARGVGSGVGGTVMDTCRCLRWSRDDDFVGDENRCCSSSVSSWRSEDGLERLREVGVGVKVVSGFGGLFVRLGVPVTGDPGNSLLALLPLLLVAGVGGGI